MLLYTGQIPFYMLMSSDLELITLDFSFASHYKQKDHNNIKL